MASLHRLRTPECRTPLFFDPALSTSLPACRLPRREWRYPVRWPRRPPRKNTGNVGRAGLFVDLKGIPAGNAEIVRLRKEIKIRALADGGDNGLGVNHIFR